MNGMHETDIPPDDLLMDPNNYRFHDREGYVTAADHRFAEEGVQRRAYTRLQGEEGMKTR